MNAGIRRQIKWSKRRIAKRLDKNNVEGCERPMFTAPNIQYEIAERTSAVSADGIGQLLTRFADRKGERLVWHVGSDGIEGVAEDVQAILLAGTHRSPRPTTECVADSDRAPSAFRR
ncbi:hypothetical protein Pan216_52130 [Planctomycetes bacterium Pan216]|uniref:Uncharacterized protein n=1 Tax=Kolteria novifilia TaxID=2527975 RepID=A0A518BBF4_9BACT|nr:hypothetical protein Pan216_52130 [Planctomycetes bacterium Pan216]